jgi:cytochrome oxidase Cu insertion factor (SCO1/SenC/PrrC family)
MADPNLSDEERRAAFATGPFHVTRKHLWLAAGVAVILGVVGAFLGIVAPDGGGPAAAQPSAPPSSSLATTPSLGLANFMELAKLSGKPAPNFTLTDQNSHEISLNSLKGKSVVLSFVDDRCGALCPVLDEELVDAWRDLGSDGSHVVFVSVNVDAAATSVGDLRSYSSAHGLTAISQWHFVTGDSAALAQVWGAYDITVDSGPPGDPVAYAPAIYFISPEGDEEYRATPFANQLANGTGALPAANVRRFGSGIAAYALRLLSGAG